MDKRKVIAIILVVMLCVTAFIIIKNHNKQKDIDIVQSNSTKKVDLVNTDFAKNLTKADVADVTKRLNNVSQHNAPTMHYYTDTQQQADEVAQQQAKKDKADKIVKQTSEPQKVGDNTIYNNNYYAVNMNRKHDIKAGVAHIDNNNYVSVSYRNRDVEYTGYYEPTKKTVGVGVSVTVAKW